MEKTKAKIFYTSLADEDTAQEKRDWFANTKLENIHFEEIHPDKNHNWVNLAEESDWEELINFCGHKGLFSLSSPGTVSNRDLWVYDFDFNTLSEKFVYECQKFKELVEAKDFTYPDVIKWSESLKTKFEKKLIPKFKSEKIVKSSFRPYTDLFYYADKFWNDRLTSNHYEFFGTSLDKQNICICLNGVGMEKAFHSIATKHLPHLQLTPNGQVVCLYKYDPSGNRLDNITDWGLEQFQSHYQDKSISKESIFHYVYAVLHNPAYRKKYELNLKREFPRIPFYSDFAQWAAWGKELMDLHIGYETVEPWPLELITVDTRPAMKKQKELFETVAEPDVLFAYQAKPKVKLKADKERGMIELDELSLLRGVPPQAWEYKLGNRSALEWILDQYKEKKPSDPTIAEKFNTYRFADYKEKVIDLLCRVCRVSVETVRIVGEMGKV